MDEITKHCAKCGQRKDRSDFHVDKRRRDGLYPWCKPCRRDYYGQTRLKPRKYATKSEYDKHYRARLTASGRRERQYRRWLWSTYRMAPSDYEQMLTAQDGKCAICGSTNPGPSTSKYGTDKGRFSVDHDHSCCPGAGSCGRCVRGLLCGPCNRGIGTFRDDPEVLENAIAYLKGWNGRAQYDDTKSAS